MPRTLYVEFKGDVYHVMTRGDRLRDRVRELLRRKGGVEERRWTEEKAATTVRAVVER